MVRLPTPLSLPTISHILAPTGKSEVGANAEVLVGSIDNTSTGEYMSGVEQSSRRRRVYSHYITIGTEASLRKSLAIGDA